MNCPNCGTYNPEDRDKCWRCDHELPKIQPKKKRNPQQTAQLWLYVIIAVFVIFTVMRTCGIGLGPQAPQQQNPSGFLAPQNPVAHQLDG